MVLADIQVDSGSKSPPEDGSQLAELRELVGVELPPLFVEFLAALGGRQISRYGFKVEGYTGTFACPVVYSLHKGLGDHNLVAELHQARAHDGVPPEVVPFACRLRGPGDGVMYLDLTERGGGRVLAYLTARPAWTGRNTHSGWIDVADSFEAYVEALLEESDGEG